MIKTISHVSILTSNLQRSVDFYSSVLELTVSGDRPKLDFDGAWFNIGKQQLHIICADSTLMPRGNVRCGRDRHIAFATDDLARLVDRLNDAGISFEASKSGRAAIFCRDPDGNALEFIGENC